ncbi:MAG: hypothetical protein WC729_29530 [Sphingomonas sp.]|jgi:hypothetical protein|uniref:hypothetical protein n=1 Tax=Sphingomonas sp. TaxID=28214 RepID=UPI003564BB6B
MPKELFRTKRFNEKALLTIDHCNRVVDDYLDQGLKLTLRQLYYQLVTINLFANSVESYKNLGKLVSDGRLAGLIDWEAIEDRVRQPREQNEWPDLSAAVKTIERVYRLPRWEGQDYYVELWVEKDALAGVLQPMADKYHVTMMVNRGYSSQSAMYEAANRFRAAEDSGTGLRRSGIILYLGDHDPSGEDMVRDIRDRMEMFGVDLDVIKVALTTAQVRQYKPLHNPAKLSDSRAKEYIKKHGPKSWELDALKPELLQRLVEVEFEAIIDMKLMKAVIAREDADKAKLRALHKERK